MKTIKIENAQHKLFNSKEDYLAFRYAWKNAANSIKTKPTHEKCNIYVPNGERSQWTLVENGGNIRHPGWLTSAHHLIFNVLRGKESTYGFTPCTRESKLVGAYNNDPYFMHNYLFKYGTFASLKRNFHEYHKYTNMDYEAAYKEQEGKKKDSWTWKRWFREDKNPKDLLYKQWDETLMRHKRQIEDFLEPFDGTVTFDMLETILKTYEEAEHD